MASRSDQKIAVALEKLETEGIGKLMGMERLFEIRLR